MLTSALGALALVALCAPISPGASSAGASADPLRCDGHVATIVGRSGAHVVRGTSGRDVIYAHDGNVVRAGSGDDLVCVVGDTRVLGGRGDDHVLVRSGSSTVIGGRGDDRIVDLGGDLTTHAEPGRDSIMNESTGVLKFDLHTSPVGVRVDLGGPHPSIVDQGRAKVRIGPAIRVYVVGTPYADVFRGSNIRDEIKGLGGNDLIDGRGGHDQLYGGSGDDTVIGGKGGDRIEVGGASTADGGPGADSYVVHGDRAAVSDASGNDTYVLHDLVPGGGPHISDTEGTSRVFLDLAPPVTGTWSQVAIDMASGTLTADGLVADLPGPLTWLWADDLAPERPAGSWDVNGTDGPDQIRVNSYAGLSGPVTLRGLGGDDVLTTGSGDDTIDGGPGNDEADAGLGNDTCVSVESGIGGQPTGCETSTD